MSATQSPSFGPPAPVTGTSPARRDVAVVIAAWRAEGTIGRAIASALAQPEAAEVVVVDDASGDNNATVRAAMAADDGSGRLKVLSMPRNAGPSAARDVAIQSSEARGSPFSTPTIHGARPARQAAGDCRPGL